MSQYAVAAPGRQGCNFHKCILNCLGSEISPLSCMIHRGFLIGFSTWRRWSNGRGLILEATKAPVHPTGGWGARTGILCLWHSMLLGKPTVQMLFLWLRPPRSKDLAFSGALLLARTEQVTSKTSMHLLSELVLDSRDGFVVHGPL